MSHENTNFEQIMDELNALGPEPVEEEAPTLPPIETLHVIVLGSFAWRNASIVQGVLSEWAAGINPAHPVTLYTTGCPFGAEEAARTWAFGMDWSVGNVRDEEFEKIAATAVFGFIKDDSAVARTVEKLASRFWTRVIRDDTSTVRSAWADH